MALDDGPDDVRPWVDGISYPVLVDRHHVVAERYEMFNVPTVVWIDEARRIVRPHDAQFPDDKFEAFHGVDFRPHLEALRRWVTEGAAPLSDDEVRAHQRRPRDEVQVARLHRRIAAHLRRVGRAEAAERHFEQALALQPLDWTIRRGSMPLRGQDPFGDAFFELYGDWEAAGRPNYPLGDR